MNAWIRSTAEFDAVIDFDRQLRDPAHPTRNLARRAGTIAARARDADAACVN